MMTRGSARAVCTDPEWLGRADCKHCGIRHMMLFADIPDEDLDLILEPIDNLRYQEKSLLYAQGEQDDKVYSIRRGVVKLIQTQPEGSFRIVRLLGRGGIIGLEALLGKPYRHTAMALQEIDVCRINAATLKRLEMERPWLNEKVMARWERHLDIADRWISELSSGSVRSRVVRLMTFLNELQGGKSNLVRFYGIEDMASMLGVTRETFSRIVSSLKDENVISRLGNGQVYQLYPKGYKGG